MDKHNRKLKTTGKQVYKFNTFLFNRKSEEKKHVNFYKTMDTLFDTLIVFLKEICGNEKAGKVTLHAKS